MRDLRALGLHAVAVVGMVVGASESHADDAALMVVLPDAGCPPSNIETTEEIGEMRVPEVACTGEPARTINVICRKPRCDPSDAYAPSGETQEG